MPLTTASPGGLPGLPAELAGPVAVALAKPVATLPRAGSLPGGARYEPKWDGFRLVLVRDHRGARAWSRQGRDLSGHFPDLVAAAAGSLPAGTVLDGEAVVWHGERLDFGLLQRRLVGAAGTVGALAERHPASFVAFDLLADGHTDLRARTADQRRAALVELATGWAPPLQLCPATTEEVEARRWSADYRPAGIEGLVVKARTGRYRPGARDWLKVKSWETTEAVVGGVIGRVERPGQLVLGRWRAGRLEVVGRTGPLSPSQVAGLAGLLTAARQHPWPEHVGPGRFGGGRLQVALTRVVPEVIVEVRADAALSAGVFRHPLRYVRPRPDLRPEDLPGL